MVIIDFQKCDECATCISACPEDALIFEEKLTFDVTRCVKCGRCVKVCPFGALCLASTAASGGNRE